MFVKFCGFTRERDVEAAADLGVSAVGFIFHPASKRCVTPERAALLGKLLDGSGIERVGVFVDAEADDIRRTAEIAGLDRLQVYSGKHRKELSGFRKIVWAGRIRTRDDLDAMGAPVDDELFLLDAYSENAFGGTGVAFNWEILSGFPHIGRSIVAGGINENNVVYLARNVRPFGVDVSSGIEEAPGVKSMEKMRTFMKNLQEALRHEGNA